MSLSGEEEEPLALTAGIRLGGVQERPDPALAEPDVQERVVDLALQEGDGVEGPPPLEFHGGQRQGPHHDPEGRARAYHRITAPRSPAAAAPTPGCATTRLGGRPRGLPDPAPGRSGRAVGERPACPGPGRA